MRQEAYQTVNFIFSLLSGPAGEDSRESATGHTSRLTNSPSPVEVAAVPFTDSYPPALRSPIQAPTWPLTCSSDELHC